MMNATGWIVLELELLFVTQHGQCHTPHIWNVFRHFMPKAECQNIRSLKYRKKESMFFSIPKDKPHN